MRARMDAAGGKADMDNWAEAGAINPFRTPLPILPHTLLAPQKSGLAARGTSASFPEYHWMFSAQACSSHSLGLIR
jgi:hypothetical protein